MRRQRSKAEWGAIFQEQNELGLADHEMQRKYGIPSSTYSKNKQKIKRQNEGEFIKLEAEKANNNHAKITFPNGLTIEVNW